MQILSVSNLNKQFGEYTLFSGVSFSINDRDRLALIGENGTGKSTILKIILGLEEMSNTNLIKGSVNFAKNIKIGYLTQEVIENIDNSLMDEALLVFKDLIRRENELNELMKEVSKNPTDHKLIEKYGKISDEFLRDGGYDYHYKIESILNRFGFKKDVWNRKISTFSGGERTKMAFAKLLLTNPDLLILDEPTNHLDVSTIDWLEGYLKNYNGAILFVSHDKYLINAIATSIVEIEHNKATLYKGNFDSYVVQKQMNYETQLKQYNLQQAEIAKMKRFIEYFKPKPRFVSRAKDREHKLEHMKVIDKPLESNRAIKFSFNGKNRFDKKILSFDKISIGYDDNKLVDPFSFLLFGGDKLAIIGDNGTGKTTFLKTILEKIQPICGEIKHLVPLKIGYLKQNDFDIKGSETVLDFLNSNFPNMGNRLARNHLGKFGFEGDDVFKTLDVLSGGEKMRLMLAKIVLENYDVLLLDEPTNHLDLPTKESLIKAMQDFEACIIFVSHDRYFIDLVSNKILYIHDGTATFFLGSYQEFKESFEKDLIDTQVNNKEKEKVVKEIVLSKEKKKANKKLLEKISIIEERLKDIEELQQMEDIYMDFMQMNELDSEKKNLEEQYILLLEEKEKEEQ